VTRGDIAGRSAAESRAPAVVPYEVSRLGAARRRELERPHVEDQRRFILKYVETV
jgi:hypothetical protein